MQAEATISSEPTPRRIGKYEVLGELGHGGMAVVYRARDTQLLRDVAVKVLHPHLASDPESRQRFLREAQAAARLRHPHIVEVFDFSVESDRESFMVSELLEGPTLRRFAELHPGMPPEIVAAIGMVLSDALSCAHGQGVIHRDVKPDNILLQTGGILKLTDFGIAHVADGNGMTVTGQVLGSPAHMAPEQIEGRRIDARADLFAAGTVLYALAVGRLPFEAPNAHALLRKILEVDYADPLRAAPSVGHRLAGIIRKCLEREPEKRFDSAEALKSALCDFVGESGWDAPEQQLKSYFEDPEGFAKKHREQLLVRLPDLGVRARRDGKLPDALGYFNRALALDPANAKVLGLVRGISRRRRIRRVATATAIVTTPAAASAGAVLFAAKHWGHRPVQMASRPPVVRPDPSLTATHVDPPVVPTPVIVPPVPTVVPPVVVPVPPPPVVATANPPGNTQRGHPGGATASASGHVQVRNPAGAAAAQRMVHLVFTPGGVSISIDGNALIPSPSWTGPLSVGRHTFRVVSNVSECEDAEWSQDVPAGTDTMRIGRDLRCH